MKRVKGYLAGKVNNRKWEWAKSHGLTELIDFDDQHTSQRMAGDPKAWNHLHPSRLKIGEMKGFGTYECVDDLIIRNLEAARVLVAYIECETSFGSIAEIGYASAQGIPVHMFFDVPIGYYDPDEDSYVEGEDKIRDTYWLCAMFPNVTPYHADEGVRRIMLEYLQKVSTAYLPPTQKQLSYMRSLGIKDEVDTRMGAASLISKAKA